MAANINVHDASDGNTKSKSSRPHRKVLKKARTNWKRLLIILVVIGIGLLTYGYIHTRNQLKELSNPKVAAQNETQDLTAKIGKLVLLPTGETPTIATVNDASRLRTVGFKSAQNGDKLLIYTKTNKAVLYRPSINRVIQYSTVNLGNGQ